AAPSLTRHFLQTRLPRLQSSTSTRPKLQHTYAEKGMDGGVIRLWDLRDVGEIRRKVGGGGGVFLGQGNEAGRWGDGGREDSCAGGIMGGIASAQWSAGKGKGMEDWETMGEYLETNLTAPFAVSQACIPLHEVEEQTQANDQTSDPGPCIIHIGSFRAHQSDLNQEGYASSKAGQARADAQHGHLLAGLRDPCEPLAHESKEGDEKGLEWAQLNEEKDVQDHPSNRAGRPEDVADAVEYLVKAGFVTGQEITVDGGATRVVKKS
ncbi:hypothetical protein D0859_02081, partial [Hortaea werneckii]